MKDLFTIIVPIYNTKIKYLSNCVESILSQKQNYEVIFVDDGSTNNDTTEYIDKLSKLRNSNIRVIRQKNKGVSSARNNGIINAKGKYLLFVDADDQLRRNALEELEKVLDNVNVDVLFFKHYACREGLYNECEIYKDLRTIETLDNKELLLKEIIVPFGMIENVNLGTPWGKVIRKELVEKNNIKFQEDLPRSQDRVFLFDCINASEKVFLYNYTGYIYNSNPFSVCAKYNKCLDIKLEKVYRALKNRINNKELEEALEMMRVNFFFEILKLDIFHKDNQMRFYQRYLELRKIYKEYEGTLKNIDKRVYSKKRAFIIERINRRNFLIISFLFYFKGIL